MAGNYKKDIGNLLRKYGYSIPISEKEVLSFEDKFKNNFEIPDKWYSADEIIKNKFPDITKIPFIDDLNNNSAYPLSMAAREGKSIPDEIRKKMNEDKKDAQK